MSSVWTPLIGQNPFHARFGGSLDELGFSPLRSLTAQTDDQRILTDEGILDASWVVVINRLGVDAGWEVVRRLASQCGNMVLARREQGGDYVGSYVASGTYNGNILDRVGGRSHGMQDSEMLKVGAPLLAADGFIAFILDIPLTCSMNTNMSLVPCRSETIE
jgi:hypothetical protein